MNSFVIGFTGTRKGLTEKQRGRILSLVEELSASGCLFCLHGDCVGADAEFDALCRSIERARVACLPCDIFSQRAFTGSTELEPPQRPIERNHKIVDMCDMVIACPSGREEELRSGTWATIRYVKKTSKPLTIVFPDGTS